MKSPVYSYWLYELDNSSQRELTRQEALGFLRLATPQPYTEARAGWFRRYTIPGPTKQIGLQITRSWLEV